MELVIIVVISLVFVPLVFFTSGVIRITLGLLFVLFFPGYVLVAALFPNKESLGRFERVALSFGLSIAVVPLIGLALNYTPWGVRLYPIVISVVTFIVILAAIAWFRRRKLPPDKRFAIHLSRGRSSRLSDSLASQSQLNKALIVFLLVSVVVIIGTLGYVAARPKAGEAFTEFYVLGNEGNAENYPREVILGEKSKVILGIVNHEHKTMVYRVEVTINGEKNNDIGSISLNPEEKWEQEVEFSRHALELIKKWSFSSIKGKMPSHIKHFICGWMLTHHSEVSFLYNIRRCCLNRIEVF